MADTTGITRVRVSLRSALFLVGGLALALVLLRVLASSQRVIGWMLMAAALAGLLHPLVVRLDRRVPRALAVVIVVIVTLGSAALAGYALVDDVRNETDRLREIAPARAREDRALRSVRRSCPRVRAGQADAAVHRGDP